ncbi:MAG: glycosyltransferase family 1 protein, partial [Monoglobaceae bacterium]
MIRVLHSVSNMDRGGIETMLMNYYRNIDRTKIQFDFISNKTKPGDYDDEIKSMGGRIFLGPGLKPNNYPEYLKFIDRILAENP